MTLITKFSLKMTFLRACTRASILCLHNCPAEQLGSCHGSWGSVHSSEEKAAPFLWKSSSSSSGVPLSVWPECLMSPGDPPGVKYSHPQVPVELLFTGWWLLWSKLEALMMNSCEKWASLEMVVKIMISSLSGEAVQTKPKWHKKDKCNIYAGGTVCWKSD